MSEITNENSVLQTYFPSTAETACADTPAGRAPKHCLARSFGKITEFILYGPQGRQAATPGFASELKDLGTTSRVAANVLLLAIVAFFIGALIWAAYAPLDEVVQGHGRVVPSTEIKRVQNFEGGIVKAILVQEGQHVQKGQILIELDQTQMISRLRELQSGYLDQMATVARLKAELSGSKTIDFPSEVKKIKPSLMETQNDLLRTRNESRHSALSALERDRRQKTQEYKELQSNLRFMEKKHALLTKELEMTQGMVSRGAASQMDLLRIQQTLTDISGNISGTRIAIPKLAAAVEGATHRIDEEKSMQRTKILSELNSVRTEMDGRKEKLPALEDQVERTSVRSPVEGTVKRVFVTTIGEAVAPGKEIVEIVPREDTLLIEAKVSPRDIAFLHPGQDANIKLTAYDSSIYGSMPGSLEYISSDAIMDPELKATYYLIKVRTKAPMLKTHNSKDLPIMSGMVAEVDILTGKKTVLDYILKPIVKTKQNALHER